MNYTQNITTGKGFMRKDSSTLEDSHKPLPRNKDRVYKLNYEKDI
jgi:hypothetical protein